MCRPSCALLMPSMSLSGVRTSPITLSKTFTLSGKAAMSARRTVKEHHTESLCYCWTSKDLKYKLKTYEILYKDTVFIQRYLLVILIEEFQAVQTNVVWVAPRGQQLQLKYDYNYDKCAVKENRT